MKLYEEYGPLIGGPHLIKVLGFRSNAAFRRSERLGMIGVRIFEIKGRKGRFARTEDVEKWLEKISESKGNSEEKEEETRKKTS